MERGEGLTWYHREVQGKGSYGSKGCGGWKAASSLGREESYCLRVTAETEH
jgi:hypothetical protein